VQQHVLGSRDGRAVVGPIHRSEEVQALLVVRQQLHGDEEVVAGS
jgi:hypothetical protein